MQSTQMPPTVPQWVSWFPLWHVPEEPQHWPTTPVQLPQLLGATHWAAEHTWPNRVQSAQLLPEAPQAVLADPATQLPVLEQQLAPLQPDDGPQAGWPGLHFRVDGSQTSDPLQAVQAAPPEPQVGLLVPATQLSFWQQPVQEAAVHRHCPAAHSWPVAQVMQVAPPVPHRGGTGLGAQPFASQQPVQLPGPQLGGGGFATQVLVGASQSWSAAAQFAQPAPPPPQAEWLVPGRAHLPLASQHPAQAPGPDGPQRPVTHCFAAASQTWPVIVQSRQAAPLFPHIPALSPRWQIPW